jgi:transposase
MPQRFQRPYPPEFRREAVRLVEATGRRYQDVAKELGISGESLRNWIKQEQLDRGDRADGLTSGERDELRRLRRRVRDLEAEREILKRAVTFFVREADPR